MTGTVESNEGILTLAFGPKRYIDLAVNLAMSVRLRNPRIPLAIATDSSDERLPAWFNKVVPIDSRTSGLVHKLKLHEYTPFDRTLFLDSDCLVFEDIHWMWNFFAGRDFAVPGEDIAEGKWFGADLLTVREQQGISHSLPKFNGGLMYWETGDIARSVFNSAQEYSQKYESLGFEPFRAGLEIADEPMISLAMATHGLGAINDNGRTMRTPLGLRGPFSVNLRKGVVSFRKGRSRVRPAVVHFCGALAEGAHYRREIAFLDRHLNGAVGAAEGLLRLKALPFCVLDTSANRERIYERYASLKSGSKAGAAVASVAKALKKRVEGPRPVG